jgi:putative addiction module component (TIGR02574 family)
MNTVKNINIQHLSQSERIILAEELWDSIADEQQNTLEVTDAQKKILEQRLAAYQASPDNTKSWEEVKNEMK